MASPDGQSSENATRRLAFQCVECGRRTDTTPIREDLSDALSAEVDAVARKSGIVVDLPVVARMLSHDRRDCGYVHGRWIALRSQCRWLGSKPEDAFRAGKRSRRCSVGHRSGTLLISHPPELARVIRPFLANADLPVIGTAAGESRCLHAQEIVFWFCATPVRIS